MSEVAVSQQVLHELQTELSAEEVRVGLHRLNSLVHLEGEDLMFSDAKAKWSAIGIRADKGRATVLRRRGGVTLLVVPLTQAVKMAASSRSDRTMGDVLRSYPGVREPEAPRLTAPGARVWSPRLPEAAEPKPR